MFNLERSLFTSAVLTILVAENVAQEQCYDGQDKAVERCLEPMMAFAGDLSTSSIFPFDGKHMLTKLCQLYDQFQLCIYGINCKSPSVDAIEASYGFMCGEAYEDFSNYVECFMKVEQHDKYQTCKSAATSGITSIQLSPFDSDNYLQQLCDIMRTYLECSKDSLVTLCDEKAWKLVKKVTKDSLKITIPGCEVNDTI